MKCSSAGEPKKGTLPFISFQYFIALLTEIVSCLSFLSCGKGKIVRRMQNSCKSICGNARHNYVRLSFTE